MKGRKWFAGLSRGTRRGERRAGASRRPRLESLEQRQLMAADYLVLDWTPDAVPGQQNTPGSLVSTFVEVRDQYGRPPSFLDFNGNRYIDANDVERAAQQIADRVGQLFGNAVQVYQGDLWQDSNWGQRFLAWGQSSPSLVNVIYVGGWDGHPDRAGKGIFGVAYQPPNGTSYEYHGYTFTSEIARFYQQHKPYATSTDFANQVAQTIAHEAGHLLGLGHVYGHPQGDPNLMSYGSDPNNSHFPNRWYRAIELTNQNLGTYYGWQNPWQEVVASYQSQPHFTPTQLGKPLYNLHHLESFDTTQDAGVLGDEALGLAGHGDHQHAHDHEHPHGHDHGHDHVHDHQHAHSHDHAQDRAHDHGAIEELVMLDRAMDASVNHASADDSGVELSTLSTEWMCMLSGLERNGRDLAGEVLAAGLWEEPLGETTAAAPSVEPFEALLAPPSRELSDATVTQDDRFSRASQAASGRELQTALPAVRRPSLAASPRAAATTIRHELATGRGRDEGKSGRAAAHDAVFDQSPTWDGSDELVELLSPLV